MAIDEETMRKKEKKKKILLIAVCAVFGVFLLFGLAALILSGIQSSLRDRAREELEEDSRRSYVYPPPDYDFDIFGDEKYLELDRNVWFNDGVTRTVITDDNRTAYPDEIQFMYDVINLIINGDYSGYNKIFTDGYLASAGNALREVFTMQQLFEIELEYMETREEGELEYIDIEITYRIRNNNGTFRNDLDYNDAGALPVVYMLIKDDAAKSIKVDNILTTRKYLSGLY
jgi:hypothetical protein